MTLLAHSDDNVIPERVGEDRDHRYNKAKALVARGFDPSMLVTEGVGALGPLVPDSDLVNRWRNRRVAIYLDKP